MADIEVAPAEQSAAAKKKARKKAAAAAKKAAAADALPEEPASEPEPISDSAANIAETTVVAGDEAAPEGEQSAAAKKRAKKKAAAARKAADGGGASTATSAKADAAKLFADALASLQSGDADALWLSLSSCAIGDKKARKLLDALSAKPAAITSLDLSDNLLSDTAAEALCAAIGGKGVAPALLQLDLSRNREMSAAGRDACAAALAPRRELTATLDAADADADAGGGGSAPADPFAAFLGGLTAAEEEAAAAVASEWSEERGEQLLTLDAAQELLSAPPPAAGCGAAVARALHSLQVHAAAEAAEASSSKHLPRALRWCSKNVVALALVMRAPAAADARRAGAHRFHIVRLLADLVGARRKELTASLLEKGAPNLLRLAALLLLRHPTSSPLHSAVDALVGAIASAGPSSRPLRHAMFVDAADGEAAAAALATALLSDALPTARAPLCRLATSIEDAAADDASLRAALAKCQRWPELAAALPALRAKWAEGAIWCGPPVARPAMQGGGGGEMGELMKMLATLQSQSGAVKQVTADI